MEHHQLLDGGEAQVVEKGDSLLSTKTNVQHEVRDSENVGNNKKNNNNDDDDDDDVDNDNDEDEDDNDDEDDQDDGKKTSNNASSNGSRGPWSREEDELLLKVMEDIRSEGFQTPKWCEVSKRLVNRSAKQCRERYVYNLDPRISKEPWSKMEDALLLYAQSQLGNSWAKIASCLPGRTENSTKTRHKSIVRARKRAWTKGEDEILLRAHRELGPKWAEISNRIKSRTPNAVKTRFKILNGTSKEQPNAPTQALILTSEEERSVIDKFRYYSAANFGQMPTTTASNANSILNSHHLSFELNPETPKNDLIFGGKRLLEQTFSPNEMSSKMRRMENSTSTTTSTSTSSSSASNQKSQSIFHPNRDAVAAAAAAAASSSVVSYSNEPIIHNSMFDMKKFFDDGNNNTIFTTNFSHFSQPPSFAAAFQHHHHLAYQQQQQQQQQHHHHQQQQQQQQHRMYQQPQQSGIHLNLNSNGQPDQVFNFELPVMDPLPYFHS